MAKARPTMKDVATAAGVSVKSVSRVVNDERWVSSDIVDRVNTAIASLGYRPDVRARSLRNSQLTGRTIGFIHADMANPFFTAVHSGVEEVTTAADCLILTGSSGDSAERQETLLRAFSDRRVDGFVIVPAADAGESGCETTDLATELARGAPTVFIDREYSQDSDLVVSDNLGGARAATQHLILHGHRRIAFLGDDPVLYSAGLRVDGFEEVTRAESLEPALKFVGLSHADQARELAHQLLDSDDPPTAFFAAKNHLSEGVIEALHQRNQQHEVALVGFDEVAMGHVIEPGITVVPQYGPELGRIAAQLLLERMDGDRTEARRVVVPVNLIERGSGEIMGPFPLADR